MNEYQIVQQFRTRINHKYHLFPSAHIINNKTQIWFIKSEVSRLCGFRNTKKYFNGANPVSFTRDKISDFTGKNSSEYVVSEKSDGVRYFLLLSRYPPQIAGGCAFAVMIDRKFRIYEIYVNAADHFFRGTLFDGELILEYHQGLSRPPRQLFLIFDVMAISNNRQISQKDYIKRYQSIVQLIDIGDSDPLKDPDNWVEKSMDLATRNKIVSGGNTLGLMFCPKRCYRTVDINIIWREVNNLRHESDGLIFTPIRDPILYGTHRRMYKWKQVHTIDLQLEITVKDNIFQFDIYFMDYPNGIPTRVDSGKVGIQLDRNLPLVVNPTEKLEEFAQKVYRKESSFELYQVIVEFSCEIKENYILCTFGKTRPDKQFANSVKTVTNTMFNIQENIQFTDLVEAILENTYQ